MATDVAGLLKLVTIPVSHEAALAILPEPMRAWFVRKFALPTLGQRLAWPVVAAGENLLLSSPTGTGKTLSAFLPILSRISGNTEHKLQCLYVAPLKALVNDVRQNLRRQVKELRLTVRIGVRTGDTSSRQRKNLCCDPPHILLTTPESLAVMLTQAEARQQFTTLRWVIVDEVHAFTAGKRGADLALSLERLEDLVHKAGGKSLQRLGLSATCTPLADVACFLAGTGRPCAVAAVQQERKFQAAIELLEEPENGLPGFVRRLVERLAPEIHHRHTTLVFTNTRNLAERLTWALRQHFPRWREAIAVHHSSLSAARRRQMERKLQHGLLRVAVSSTSLELGIDIGRVDTVVLVHPPGSTIRFLQRVGRSGHQPGSMGHGLILTASVAELLEAAVTAASGQQNLQEPMRPLEAPLDVLCQHLFGLATQAWWSTTAALALVRRAFPYRHLSEADFQSCLDYLSGLNNLGQPWLPARIRWENNCFTMLDDWTARLLRRNLGTIVAEEPRIVRLQLPDQPGEDFGPKTVVLGDLDEAFVDQLQVGDRFVLDGRCLEYLRQERSALVVGEITGRPQVPRWTGSSWPMSRELAQRIYDLRVQAGEAWRDGPEHLATFLQQDLDLNDPAVAKLVTLISLQECVSEIPDHQSLLIEVVGSLDGATYFMHTPLARSGNEVLAQVLSKRLRQRNLDCTIVPANLGIVIVVSGQEEIPAPTWGSLLAPAGLPDDLQAWKASDTVRERFQQVAQIGLMLLRNPQGRRRRVGGRNWAQRRLYDQVAAVEPDFLFIRQAWREVQQDVGDLEADKTRPRESSSLL